MSTPPHTDRVSLWLTWYRAINTMNATTQQLAADVLASAMIVFLAWDVGADPTFATATIAMINTLNVTEAVAALREAQVKNRQDMLDSDE